MRKITLGILAGVFAVSAFGCAMDDSPTTSGASDEIASAPWAVSRASSDESSPSTSNFASADFGAQPDAIKPRVTLSFFATCINPSAQGVGNVATHAQADACRRFDGSFGGFTSWNGSCTTDVSNCNGRLVCQNHCP